MLVIKDTATNTIYPAETCTWVEIPSTGSGYDIGTVKTYISGTAVAIAAAELGYLGKSGRFVKMSK
jgi:hypothetical protein